MNLHRLQIADERTVSNRTDALMPGSAQRLDLLSQASGRIDQYYANIDGVAVVPQVTPEQIRDRLGSLDFEQARDAGAVLGETCDQLEQWSLQIAHPRYFGLFNPSPAFQGVIADLLVAAYNPQLGAWHHSPVAVEIEAHLVRYFADRFGMPDTAFGHFTSGGSEANYTSVLIALTYQFPAFARQGLRGLDGQPVLYCSTEFHHSFEKIAHQCGIGRDAVRLVPVTDQFVMDPARLEAMIREDIAAGLRPFLVNATAGTTNAGLVEPLDQIAVIARRFGLHLHVDAAWGGGVVLSDRHRPKLQGIELADSITCDPHKMLSVPMGAGMVIVREQAWLADTFGLHTDYVPDSAVADLENYRTGFQFSRRFIGLKLFMTLTTIGRKQYAAIIDQQLALAHKLAGKLARHSFKILNGASLGVVCFQPPKAWEVSSHQQLEDISKGVCDSGQAWISTTRLGGNSVLRACITNHLTRERDLDRLVELIMQQRP